MSKFCHGLIVWLSFIDDMLIVCKEMGMAQVKEHFMSMVDCEDVNGGVSSHKKLMLT